MTSTNLVSPSSRLAEPSIYDGYIASALGLKQSFSLLIDAGPEHCRAACLVGGLILECLLKAHLTKQGLEQQKLGSQDLRHDLQNLWSSAQNLGLPVTNECPQWLATLNSLHFRNKESTANGNTYAIRYQGPYHGLTYPNLQEMQAGVLQIYGMVIDANHFNSL